MTRSYSLSITLLLGGALAMAACTFGETLEDGQLPDDPQDPGNLTLSGSVVGFKNTPVSGAALATVGLTPELTGTSDANGAFSFSVPANSTFSVSAGLADHLPTSNPLVAVTTASVVRRVMLVSTLEADAQYAAANVIKQPGTAVVVAELLKGDGTARDGVLLADVGLVDGLQAPVIADGPFALGLNGDIDLAATTVNLLDNRALVIFLNVPPGILTLSATYPLDNDGGGGGGGGGGGNNIKTAQFTSIGDAAMILRVNDPAVSGL